jgi:hypothetical protein
MAMSSGRSLVIEEILKHEYKVWSAVLGQSARVGGVEVGDIRLGDCREALEGCPFVICHASLRLFNLKIQTIHSL